MCNEAVDGVHAGEQRRLEDAHEDGKFGLAFDFEAALTWYQKAAECGNDYGQRRLGIACEYGEFYSDFDLVTYEEGG